MSVSMRTHHALVAVIFAAALVPASGFAASCIEGAAKMSDSDMQSFLSSPDGLLSTNASGGLSLSNSVRQIVASNSDSLDAVMKLVAAANKSQASAIAGGLARAVQACKVVDPAYADKIQQSVASIQDTSFQEAFASASNQIATASLGQGAGQAVGGGSTQANNSQSGGTNGSGASAPGSQTFANSGFSFSSGTSGRFVSSPTN